MDIWEDMKEFEKKQSREDWTEYGENLWAHLIKLGDKGNIIKQAIENWEGTQENFKNKARVEQLEHRLQFESTRFIEESNKYDYIWRIFQELLVRYAKIKTELEKDCDGA